MNKDFSILTVDTLIKYIDDFLSEQKGTQYKIEPIGKARGALLRLKTAITELNLSEINIILKELISYKQYVPEEYKENYNGYLDVLQHYLT